MGLCSSSIIRHPQMGTSVVGSEEEVKCYRNTGCFFKGFLFCKQIHLELLNFSKPNQALATSTHPSLPERVPAATIAFHCSAELGCDHTTSGPKENTITHSESLHKLKYVIY